MNEKPDGTQRWPYFVPKSYGNWRVHMHNGDDIRTLMLIPNEDKAAAYWRLCQKKGFVRGVDIQPKREGYEPLQGSTTIKERKRYLITDRTSRMEFVRTLSAGLVLLDPVLIHEMGVHQRQLIDYARIPRALQPEPPTPEIIYLGEDTDDEEQMREEDELRARRSRRSEIAWNLV